MAIPSDSLSSASYTALGPEREAMEEGGKDLKDKPRHLFTGNVLILLDGIASAKVSDPSCLSCNYTVTVHYHAPTAHSKVFEFDNVLIARNVVREISQHLNALG